MNIVKKISVMLMMVLLVVAMALPAFASTTTTAAPEQTQVQEEQEDSTDGLKAIAAGMAIGLAAAGWASSAARRRKVSPASRIWKARSAPPSCWIWYLLRPQLSTPCLSSS